MLADREEVCLEARDVEDITEADSSTMDCDINGTMSFDGKGGAVSKMDDFMGGIRWIPREDGIKKTRIKDHMIGSSTVDNKSVCII